MLAQSIRAYPLQVQLNFALGKGRILPPYSNCFLLSFAVRIQVIFSQSRGNLLVCEELTLEKMKSAILISRTTSLIAKKASSSFCRPVVSLFGCTIFSELRGCWDSWALGYHESSDCFEHPKTPFLNQTTQKVLAKFSCLKNSFDLSRQLKSEVPLLSPSLEKKTAV